MKYSNSKKKAFTLVELLVTMSIISILAAMSISSYPKFSEQMALTAETYKMLAYFRETQVFGVSALVNPGTKVAYAFLIEKNLNESAELSGVKRVLIENPTDKTNTYYKANGVIDAGAPVLEIKKAFKITEINGVLQNSTTSLEMAYGYFRRPNPESRLFGISNLNILPGVDIQSFDRLEVIVSSKKNSAFKKKIVILQTGQMYVSDW